MLFASPGQGLNWNITDANGQNVSPFNSTGKGEYVEYTVDGQEPFTVTTDQGGGDNPKSIEGVTQKDLIIAIGPGPQYFLRKVTYFKYR